MASFSFAVLFFVLWISPCLKRRKHVLQQKSVFCWNKQWSKKLLCFKCTLTNPFHDLGTVTFNLEPTLFRATLDLPKEWKHRENSWADLGGPSPNKWWTYDWCAFQLLPTCFERGITDETSWSKICASSAYGKSKAVTVKCVPWIVSWKFIWIVFRKSSLVMKACVTEFLQVEEAKNIEKNNKKQNNGDIKIHHFTRVLALL